MSLGKAFGILAAVVVATLLFAHWAGREDREAAKAAERSRVLAQYRKNRAPAAPANYLNTAWRYHAGDDDFTGERRASASTSKRGRVYRNTTLFVQCDRRTDFSVYLYAEYLNLAGGCSVSCGFHAKFDDAAPATWRGRESDTGRHLFFHKQPIGQRHDLTWFANKLRTSNEVVLRLRYYAEGNVDIPFDLAGSGEKIGKVMRECGIAPPTPRLAQ